MPAYVYQPRIKKLFKQNLLPLPCFMSVLKDFDCDFNIAASGARQNWKPVIFGQNGKSPILKVEKVHFCRTRIDVAQSKITLSPQN